jgi:hypothetical protein
MGGRGKELLTWNITRYGELPKRNTTVSGLDTHAQAKLLRDYKCNKLFLHKMYECIAVHGELDSGVIFYVYKPLYLMWR